VIATATTSPLCIVIEFGDSLDPPHRLFFVFPIETRDLFGNPAPDWLRASIRNDQAQLAQCADPPPLSHRSHPFRRFCHARLYRPAGECNALQAEIPPTPRMTLLSSSAMLAPFQVRSFRFQWPADLLTSWGIEMENLVLGAKRQSKHKYAVFSTLTWRR
jgi:hypothetical protein